MIITIRPALWDELERVNELRRMVNDVHVSGRPDIFRPGFAAELQERVYSLYDSGEAVILAALIDEVICGFAIVNVISRPLSPYNLARRYYHVEEFGVDEAYRRRGVASALVEYMKNDAKRQGLDKIELDVWAFNESALAFYKAAGFTTYRRYMEMNV